MDEAAWFESPIWMYSAHLALLSFAALGGGIAMLMPELQRFLVIDHQWMTNEQFVTAFTIGLASPGPNFLYVVLIGWHLAGVKGALLATFAVMIPPSLVCYGVLRFGQSRVSPRLQKAMRDGLAPVSAGMMLAFGWVLCSAVDTNWQAALVTLITVVVIMRTRLNPVLLVGAGALLGMAGLV